MRFFKKNKRKGWSALKFGGAYVSYAHVERNNGKPVVTDWAHQSLDLDGAGVMQTFADEHQLDARRCVNLLSRSEYQLLQIEAVKVPAAEVKQAVRWAIKDMLDCPVTNATIDVLDIPADQANPSRQRYMLAVATRNEVVRDRVVRLIDHASIGLEAIDIAEIAQRNVAALLEQQGRGLALLSFSEDGGLVTFTADGELYHSRQLDVSLESLQVNDEDRRTMTYDRVALDLQRTLDNFERQFPYIAVNKLLIAPFPMRAGLVDYLKSYLSQQVDTFELSDIFNIDAIPQLSEVAMQARALSILGVALREGE